ncbi:reverse transcriptase domain-containing protein [Tanacetum coccineum]
MKKSIAELAMLTAPKEKEELIIYLAAVKEAISAVLITKRDGKQVPIYFVSRALQGPKINYTLMEKLILALVKRVLKWSFELQEHDIYYRPRTSIKGQILADFIVEHGSSCIDGSGAGLILTNPKGMEFTYALRFRFDATNNEAEYEALIAGLRIVEHMVLPTSKEKSIDEKEVLTVVEEEGRTWMTPIHEYLTKEILPEEKRKARTKRRKAGRFGFPREIISDSGKQFRDNPFKDWCKKLCIRQCFASVKHPQANGLVERANTSLGVVIQVDIGMPTLRTAEVDMIKNDEALEINLDLLERKESRQQYRKQKAKLRWKNTTMPEFAIQVSGQETSSTRTKRAMQKMEVSSDLSGKDHTRSQKH